MLTTSSFLIWLSRLMMLIRDYTSSEGTRLSNELDAKIAADGTGRA